jgi:chemotaxis protein methyltransferase CheR
VRRGEWFCVRETLGSGIDFRLEDIRVTQPVGSFHLILCRYLLFTYFEPRLQARLLAAMVDPLVLAGMLVTGKREALPEGAWGLTALSPRLGVYQRVV